MKIEWYPGHMAKARRLIEETIRGIDVIIEVLDARLPASSSNPMLGKLRGGKPCIKVMNKSDLADPEVTKAWVEHFKQPGMRALPLQAHVRLEANRLPKLCQQLAPHRGTPGKSLRAMIVGIPNVGKSTLINTLAGRKLAKVGDKPAVTTCQQVIDLKNGILLCDTPGLLWPDMRNQAGAYRLAASGAIGEAALDYTEVALFAVAYLARRYPTLLSERYKLATLPDTPVLMLEEIGRRRGCLVGGGEVDLHRAGEQFLRELRAGALGRISLEEPGEQQNDTNAEVDEEEDTDAPQGL
jgi:ribosome biogenesis GTPase A